MPTYEYKCDACGHAFEKFQSMSAAPVKVCPSCGKRKVRKLISSGAGLIFKGSGFYITDYREQGYKDKAKADSTASETKTETKSDAKPDAKSDAKPAETKAEAPKVEAPKKAEPPKTSRSDSAKSSSKSKKK